jgi:hypothetical protein
VLRFAAIKCVRSLARFRARVWNFLRDSLSKVAVGQFGPEGCLLLFPRVSLADLICRDFFSNAAIPPFVQMI